MTDRWIRVLITSFAVLPLCGQAYSSNVPLCFSGEVQTMTAVSTGINSDEVFFNIVGKSAGDASRTNRVFVIKDHLIKAGADGAVVPAAPGALAAKTAMIAAAVKTHIPVAVLFQPPAPGENPVADTIQYGQGCPVEDRKRP